MAVIRSTDSYIRLMTTRLMSSRGLLKASRSALTIAAHRTVQRQRAATDVNTVEPGDVAWLRDQVFDDLFEIRTWRPLTPCGRSSAQPATNSLKSCAPPRRTCCEIGNRHRWVEVRSRY